MSAQIRASFGAALLLALCSFAGCKRSPRHQGAPVGPAAAPAPGPGAPSNQPADTLPGSAPEHAGGCLSGEAIERIVRPPFIHGLNGSNSVEIIGDIDMDGTPDYAVGDIQSCGSAGCMWTIYASQRGCWRKLGATQAMTARRGTEASQGVHTVEFLRRGFDLQNPAVTYWHPFAFDGAALREVPLARDQLSACLGACSTTGTECVGTRCRLGDESHLGVHIDYVALSRAYPGSVLRVCADLCGPQSCSNPIRLDTGRQVVLARADAPSCQLSLDGFNKGFQFRVEIDGRPIVAEHLAPPRGFEPTAATLRGGIALKPTSPDVVGISLGLLVVAGE